jgi:hypothetical protein
MRETLARQRGSLRRIIKKKRDEKQREKGRKKMAIERCDKCGKAFMSQSEVERHKMYEHPMPISPFEERRSTSDTSRNNGSRNIEDLQKMTSDVTTGKSNSDNNDIRSIGGGGQIRKVPFRPFRA